VYNDKAVVDNILDSDYKPKIMRTASKRALKVVRSGVHTPSKIKEKLKTKLKSKRRDSTKEKRPEYKSDRGNLSIVQNTALSVSNHDE